MSIRPVDMQVLVPRTTEISKSQHSELHRHDVLQQQFSERLEKQTLLSNQQVQESNKSEKQTITRDNPKKNKQKYESDNRKKRSKSLNDTDDDSDNKENSSMFDIRI